MKKYSSFKEFYPFYLSQHKNKTCRLLHFLGSLAIIIIIPIAIIMKDLKLFLISPIIAYSMAWTGHFIFERNKPATFNYPFYSFLGDWFMFKDIIFMKLKIF